MQEVGIWLTPLLLLPGVGLLLMSTSIRSGQVHEEFHHNHNRPEQTTIEHLLLRARLFRDALVLLYVSAASLALASLSGGFVHLVGKTPFWSVMFLTGIAVLALLIATAQLIRESLLSLKIIQTHADEFRAA